MRARGRLLALCLAPAAWLLGGCGQDIEHTWFPLADGLHWEYRVTRTDARGQREVESFSQTNLGRTTLQGTTVFERRNSHGTHYFIEAREDGLYRLASQNIGDFHPQMDRPPRLILPDPPERITEWRAPTVTYLLKRIFPFERHYRHRASIKLEFRVAATGVSVTVPAGRFDNCLRVDAEAEIQVSSDPRYGPAPVPITQSEWYCPDTGLVKLTRHEELDSDQAAIIGGDLQMELIRFDD
ncbi:hypothetical protein [Spectribacter hydrogenoxidans]|uniref:Lipoprotein n=1 Tax=Spectribacter hydrogenoxidans TaxID=3075608 RepID=A0ABU3BX46_9GAMM|nr:hypothetical protein [Salinisphaera sp. W335]MDT0633815.1 hypothetical protein [Salinisphaera sp. W335]